MDSNIIWGGVLIAYVAPYIIWIISRDQTLDIRKKLYPGRPQEEAFDTKSTRYGLLWSVGLALLVLAWWIKVTPLGALLLFVVSAVVVGCGFWLPKQKRLLASRGFRFWAAGTIVWLLVVIAWFLIFMHDTSLRNYQFALIGVLPSVIGAVAILMLRWARSDTSRKQEREA
jgi:hypothetical protein